MIDLLLLLIHVLLIRFSATVGQFQGTHMLSQLGVLRLQLLNFQDRLFESPSPGFARQRPQLVEIPLQLLLRPLHQFAVQPAVEVLVLLLHGVEFRGQQALGQVYQEFARPGGALLSGQPQFILGVEVGRRPFELNLEEPFSIRMRTSGKANRPASPLRASPGSLLITSPLQQWYDYWSIHPV